MLRIVEKVFCIGALSFLAAAFMPRSGGSFDTNDPRMFAAQLVVYGLTLTFIALHHREVVTAVTKSWLLMVLVILAPVSTLWSPAPEVTIKRSLLLIATTGFGFYFGSCFSGREQLEILSTTALILAVFSVAVYFVSPGFALDNEAHVGALRGVFPHKNMLGRFMVLGIMSFLCWVPLSSWGRLARVAGLATCAALVVLSRSRDAILIAALLGVCSLVALKTKRTWIVGALIVAVVTSAAVFVLAPGTAQAVLESIGRDSTLTGRSDIWAACIESISERPLLGYGYGTFWRGLASPSLHVIASAEWMVPHAHNGYLDFLLDLGFAGGAVLLCFLAFHMIDASRFFRERRHRGSWWPLLYFTFVFLYNLGESSIARPNSVFWALLVASSAKMAIARLPQTSEVHFIEVPIRPAEIA